MREFSDADIKLFNELYDDASQHIIHTTTKTCTGFGWNISEIAQMSVMIVDRLAREYGVIENDDDPREAG